jgi:hypothetical protein
MSEIISSIYNFFESRGFFRKNQNILEKDFSCNTPKKTQSDSQVKTNESLISSDLSPSNEWSFTRIFQEKMLSDNEINVSLSILKNQFVSKKGLKGFFEFILSFVKIQSISCGLSAAPVPGQRSGLALL